MTRISEPDKVRTQKAAGATGMKVTIRRMLSYLTRYKFRFSCAVLLMIGFSVAMGILPALMGAATDIITGKGSIQDLTPIIVGFILDAVL